MGLAEVPATLATHGSWVPTRVSLVPGRCMKEFLSGLMGGSELEENGAVLSSGGFLSPENCSRGGLGPSTSF